MRPSTHRTSSLSAKPKGELLPERVRDGGEAQQRCPSYPILRAYVMGHQESERRHKQGQEGITRGQDSITPGSTHPYEQFFTNTVAELHTSVIEMLRNTDMDKVTRSCAEVSVKLLDTGQSGISLSGDWQMLCEARTRITQIINPPGLTELDDDDQKGLQTTGKESARAHSAKHVGTTLPSTAATDEDVGAVDRKKQFQCDHCLNKFSDLRQLTKHMTVAHDGQVLSAGKVSSAGKKPYVCSVCGKSFSTSSYRKDHENIHNGQEPYICKVCGKSFWAQCHLWKHAQSHKKKSHQCLICKKRFTFRAGLRAHMVKHTRAGKHRCEMCGRVYTQRQTLLRHRCKGHTHSPATNNLDAATQLVTRDKTSAAINLIGELNKLSEGTTELARHEVADHLVPLSTEPVRETTRGSLANYGTPTTGDTQGDGAVINHSHIVSAPLVVSLPSTESIVTSPPRNRRNTRSSTRPKHVPTASPFSCSHCPQQFTTKAELVKHKQFHHDPGLRKQPLEPKGEMTEVSELSTTEFKVLADTRGVRWYECRVCLLTGTRRFRMAAHYRVSHTENGGVPFNMIINPSDGNTSVADQSAINQDTVGESESTRTGKNTVRCPPKLSRLQLKHPERATEECHKCGYKTSVAGLRNHMRTKHTKYLYQCQVCTKSFSTLFALRSHYRTHADGILGQTNIEPVPEFPCDKCGKTFTRNVDLVHHQKLGASCSDKPPDPKQYNPPYGEGKYLCEVCGYSALQRVHVVQHHARRHAPRDVHCDQCSLTFAYERDLNKHRNVSHVEEKTHKCEICGKCFASSKYLTSHQQRHEQVKKHFCVVCNKGFLEKYRMTQHMETHKAASERHNLFPCRVCGKAFTTNSYRKDHENIHSGRQPYACKQCGKTLKAQCHMWKHMQLHHADKTHACHVCGKTFRFKAGLTAHVVTHTRSGQHRCEACGKVYTQRQTLQRHVCKSSILSATQAIAGETHEAAGTTPDIYIPPSVNTAAVYTQGINDGQELDTALDIEQESSTQQNVYMCSECNDIFYDWNEVNDHLLTHTAVKNTTQVLMEVGDHSNFAIQVLPTSHDPQGSDANTAVVNIIDSDGVQHVGQDLTCTAISVPDVIQTVSQDIQSDVVSVSNVAQSVGEELTPPESDMMGAVVHDTQSNMVLAPSVMPSGSQHLTPVVVLEADMSQSVVSVSGVTHSGVPVEIVPEGGTETAVEDWSILVNAPQTDKQLNIKTSETGAPVVFIDTQSIM